MSYAFPSSYEISSFSSICAILICLLFELELLRNYFEYLYWTTSNQLMKEEQEQLLNLFIKYHKTDRHELAPFPYPASSKESGIPELTFTDREWNTHSWICHTTKTTLSMNGEKMVTGNCYRKLDSSEAMDKCYQGNGALQAVFFKKQGMTQ